MNPLVVAENEWLIAIDKPAGLIVHSDGRTEEPSLADWIGENRPSLRGIGGSWISPQGEHVALNGLVHRLDRTTSGIILAAKSDEAFAYLRSEFKARRVEKKYLAWVYGRLSKTEGSVVAEIVRSKDSPKRWYARTTEESDPRAAITDWKVLKIAENATLLDVTPKTGRTHQIRVHLASLGCPVVSDHLYAADWKELMGFKRPALHALSLRLRLPDNVIREFRADPPADFPH